MIPGPDRTAMVISISHLSKKIRKLTVVLFFFGVRLLYETRTS